MGWLDAVGGQGELGRERRVAGAELEGFGDHLVVDGLVTLPDRCRALMQSDARRCHRQDGQQGQEGETAAPPAAAAGGGPFAGVQEAALRAGEGRGARRVGGPPGHGLLERGQLRSPVQEGRVVVAVVPGGGGVGELAVHDPAGLVLLQPAAQPGPGPQQHVMRELGRIAIQDGQPLGGERVQHGVDVGAVRARQPGVQVAAG